MSLYRKLTPAEVLAMIAGAKSNTKPASLRQEQAESITSNTDVSVAPEPEQAATIGASPAGQHTPAGALPAETAAKTNNRYKVGQAAYMRAYRARKKAEKSAAG